MVYIIIALVISLLSDLYIWFTFLKGGNLLWSILYWVPLCLFISLPVLALTGYWQNQLFRLFIFFSLVVVLPKIVFTLFSLIGRILPISNVYGNIVGLICAILLILSVLYGLVYGWKRVVEKNVPIIHDDIPSSFNGYKIVHLSDFHIGTYKNSPETVDKIVEKVNALQPDMIVFTGDLVNSDSEEVIPFLTALSRLKAKDGIYSILGNHDYCTYKNYVAPDSPKRNLQRLMTYEKKIGWNLLMNENRIIRHGNDSIALIGVENDGKPPFPAYADLDKAMNGVDKAMFKILLSHDPSHWRREVLPKTDIQLTLSGHTHALQVKIGNFSPAAWVHKEWGGMYNEKGRLLYISVGTGSNIPFRIGAWPEIDLIKLYKK